MQQLCSFVGKQLALYYSIMKTTFSERLKSARKSKGLSQKELGESVGISQAAIQKIETGKAASSTYAYQLAVKLGVSPNWLISGAGSPQADIPASVPDENEWGKVDGWSGESPLPQDEVEIPYLKDIELAAGDGGVIDSDYNAFKLRFSKSTLRRVGANTDGSGVVCFPARGNSMEPNIPDGTTVAVNIHDKKIVDGKIYAISERGWKRLKCLYRVGPDMISIRSYNSTEYPPEEKPISEIEIIGRVFWWSYIDC